MELTPSLHAFIWTLPAANNCNTFLIRTQEKTILIDPGHAAHFPHVQQDLSGLGITTGDVDLIICTHAHPDHMEAVGLFDCEKTLFAMHEAEWNLVMAMADRFKAATGTDPKQLNPDFFLTEGRLDAGDVALDVYHTPGHSRGGITLYWAAEKALFTGDLIFANGLGRTDLPGGNSAQLKESIRRMSGLDSRFLLSGHGDVVTGEDAVKRNFDQVATMWFNYL